MKFLFAEEKKGFFRQKQTSTKKNQSLCAKKICHTSLISEAPSSPEFIRHHEVVYATLSV